MSNGQEPTRTPSCPSRVSHTIVKVSSGQLTGEFSLVTVLVLPCFDFSLMFLCLTIKDIMCSLIKLLPNCMRRFNLALMKVNLFHEKVQV